MLTLTHDLASIVSTIRYDGNYYCTGNVEMAMPALEVNGVGRISLPLLPVQAEQLIALATRSPFGRGEQTLVDTSVRKTWQIPPEQVTLSGRGWPATLDAIVARAAAGLGVDGPVSAELYKLLVYDAGSFFVEHRDTEKSPGMFATLVLVLPSVCGGGELIVRHRGHEVSLDLNSPEPSDAAFAAFYADCVHEVRPVTQGYRLTLIYNLLRKEKGSSPTPALYEEQRAAITALLARWVHGKNSAHDETPEKLIYPLEHAYTPAELAFSTLKNADAAAAAALVPAAANAGCDLHLALVTIEESGSAEYNYVPRGRGRWYSRGDERDEDFEIGEVFERSLTVSHWCSPDGAAVAIGPLPFLEEELCPPDSFEDMDPDEQHFHEATGNEGASFERTYQRAALVLWPSDRKLGVLNQAGLAVTLPYLTDLASRWAGGGDTKDSPLWRDAHTLSGHMLASWPATPYYSGSTRASNERMLSALAQLADIERIDGFLSDVSAAGRYDGKENGALAAAAALLTPQRAGDLIERIVARNAHMLPGACADLLARLCCHAPFATSPARLRPASAALVETLLGERANAHPPDPWHKPAPIDANLVDDLVHVLAVADAAPLAGRFVNHALANRATFGLDAILVPAALKLTQRAQPRHDPAALRLRQACQDHLRARVDEPLAAPADFARPCALVCHCGHCTELARFLADPARSEWVVKAAELQRRHVETSVRQSRCDLDLATRRQGSPHSLVATKNQASYERRVVQRKNDLANLAQLDLAHAPPA